MNVEIRIDFRAMRFCLFSVNDQEAIGKTYASYKRAYWAKQTLEAVCV